MLPAYHHPPAAVRQNLARLASSPPCRLRHVLEHYPPFWLTIGVFMPILLKDDALFDGSRPMLSSRRSEMNAKLQL